MHHHHIKNITNRHYLNLKKHFKKVKKRFDDEAIHQLRVEYKKLRAFLRLISGVNGRKETAKISGKLKQCYAVAGSIRDLQLQQQRILDISKQEPKKPWGYIDLLQQHINRLKPDLEKLLVKKVIEKKKKKIDTIIPPALQLSDFKNYTEKIRASIFHIVEQENINDEDIHKVRKLLKDLFYNLKELARIEEGVIALNGIAGKNEMYFDQLLEEIGNYQDTFNAIELLKPKWIYKLNTQNQESLLRIKELFMEDKSKLKRTLEQRLKSDLSKTMHYNFHY